MKYLFLLLFLIGCGEIPKEGSEEMDVKIEIKYDNNTNQRYLAKQKFIFLGNKE